MQELRGSDNKNLDRHRRKALADGSSDVERPEVALSDSQYLPDLLLVNGGIYEARMDLSEDSHNRPRDAANWNFTSLYSAGAQVAS